MPDLILDITALIAAAGAKAAALRKQAATLAADADSYDALASNLPSIPSSWTAVSVSALNTLIQEAKNAASQ